MNNKWNKLIYKVWSPVYDQIFNAGTFLEARKSIFHAPPFEKNQKILFVGVGTGADLELINPADYEITAIDYSPDMLEKAKAKHPHSAIQFFEMDAQQMEFPDHQFDAVVGSLILSVVPESDACLKEMIRLCKPNGTILIFDKFSSQTKELSLLKKAARPVIKLLGTDIGVSFEKLYEQNKEAITIQEDTPVLFGGMYRKIVLQKKRNKLP